MKKNGPVKQRPWIDRLLLSVIFSLTVVIGLFIFTTGDSKFQSTTATENTIVDINEPVNENISIPETFSEKPSNFADIQIITQSSSDEKIPYTLHYPKTNFEQANNEISRYISSAKEEYLNKTNTFKQENPNTDVVGDFRIALEIHPFSDDYYSFVLTNKSSVDRTIYATSIQTYLLNKHTGEFINAYQLLDKKVPNLEVFANYVRTQFEQKYGNFVYTEKMLALTEPKWRHFSRFAIVGEELVLYYDKNEVVDPLAGMPTIRFPLANLKPLLADPFKVGNNNGKRVALTFDDGPHDKITRQILASLEKYDAKATFFMVGRRVSNNANLVKEIYNRGHEIGNHTWDHARLTDIKSKQVLAQVNSTNKAIFDIIGQEPTVFRPPYGAKNKEVTKLIDAPVVMWTIDTLDWKYRDSKKLLPMVKKNMHNNAIILMHDIHQSTADGLDSVLAYLQKEGYEFVTVSEILAYQK